MLRRCKRCKLTPLRTTRNTRQNKSKKFNCFFFLIQDAFALGRQKVVWPYQKMIPTTVCLNQFFAIVKSIHTRKWKLYMMPETNTPSPNISSIIVSSKKEKQNLICIHSSSHWSTPSEQSFLPMMRVFSIRMQWLTDSYVVGFFYSTISVPSRENKRRIPYAPSWALISFSLGSVVSTVCI